MFLPFKRETLKRETPADGQSLQFFLGAEIVILINVINV
jgi:hypothetical protein